MNQNVPTVTVDELPAGVNLLDVREADEWAAGHAPDAVHMPMNEIEGRFAELSKDDTVYVICQLGGRSARATAFLNANGLRAVNVGGGMKAWHAAGGTLVGGLDGAEPEVI